MATSTLRKRLEKIEAADRSRRPDAALVAKIEAMSRLTEADLALLRADREAQRRGEPRQWSEALSEAYRRLGHDCRIRLEAYGDDSKFGRAFFKAMTTRPNWKEYAPAQSAAGDRGRSSGDTIEAT